jgi:basic amino acid/polyamine antiporter, APA family
LNYDLGNSLRAGAMCDMLCSVSTQRRELGLVSTMAVVIGESIALGIFLTPATMAKSLGSPLLLCLVWLGMALMAMCGALCYSELAIRFPESGGEYVYLRAGYGEQVAFFYGWMSTVVMYPGVAAALAFGASAYVSQLLPTHPRGVLAVPALLLCVFGLVNLVGTRFSGAVMSFVNVLKLVILFGLVAWAVLSGHAHVANLVPLTIRRPGADALMPAIAGAAVSAFFSFGGWWEASKIAGEVRKPRRTLPLAFIGGVSVVMLVYLGISGAFLAVVPLSRVTSNTAFVAQFGVALFGPAGGRILSACVLVCVCGGIAALSMAAPRVIYAMAAKGSFFPAFGRLHQQFGTPVYAILLQTALSLLVLALGAFDRVLAFIIFSAVLFLALTVSTLFRLPERLKAWWYPVAPVLFIVFCFIVDALILLHDPIPALIGVAIVLCGIPARLLIRSDASSSSLAVVPD